MTFKGIMKLDFVLKNYEINFLSNSNGLFVVKPEVWGK